MCEKQTGFASFFSKKWGSEGYCEPQLPSFKKKTRTPARTVNGEPSEWPSFFKCFDVLVIECGRFRQGDILSIPI